MNHEIKKLLSEILLDIHQHVRRMTAKKPIMLVLYILLQPCLGIVYFSGQGLLGYAAM